MQVKVVWKLNLMHVHVFRRVVQYSSRFLYWLMEQRGVSEAVINKAKELEKQISTARKCQCVALCAVLNLSQHYFDVQ